MRWPLRRHPRPTEHHSAGPADPPIPRHDGAHERADAADGAADGATREHPDRSRPRADWAHLAPVVTAMRPAAPVTFHGEQFGRSVAGGRPMIERHHARHGAAAPAGVLLDVAQVETVLPHAGHDAHDAPIIPDVASASTTATIVHRKPVVAPAGDRALTTSDLVVDFPTIRRPGELDESPGPVTWTPDGGFVEPEHDDQDHEGDPDPGRAPTRIIRRRPHLDPAADNDATDAVTDETAGDDGDPSPSVRYVAAPGRRLVAPPRDLIDLVEQQTGMYVGDAEIDRSPAVTARAADLGAIAFTEQGTVHLPAELGPIDDPGVRAVTAHELVHVAQQRARGGSLPSEESEEGRELEGRARAIQRQVAATGVTPTFLRSSPGATGTIGVQRLANEHSDWVGVDLSEEDYSDIEPQSGSDPFAWQEREGEPTGPDWDTRREWDRQFERDNASQLQLRRDERYRELLEQAGGGTVSRDAAMAARRRLESDMPYQFGPPFGIDPYPDSLPGDVGAGVAAIVAPVATEAETSGALLALRHITSNARDRHATAGDGNYSLSDLDDVFERRFQREREMRLEVLEAKRRAASGEQASPDHVVSISDAELAQIREAVDLEIPLDVAYPQYLDTDQAMRKSVAGEIDAPFPAGASARVSPGRTGGGAAAWSAAAGAGTARGGGAGGGADTGAGAAAATDEAQQNAAATALQAILDEVNERPPAENAGAFSRGDLDDRFTVRFQYELQLRQRVLTQKVIAAVAHGATAGTEVTITDAELQQIREAVDLELPLDVPYPQYEPSSDHMSHTVTADDIVAHGGAAGTASTGAASTDAAATATAPAVTAAATGAALVPIGGEETASSVSRTDDDVWGTAATGGGLAREVLATGTSALIGMMANDEPYAGHELAGRVVEQMSDMDVDVLSRRVWTRLRRELRNELLLDRERSGTLADVR